MVVLSLVILYVHVGEQISLVNQGSVMRISVTYVS